MAHTDRKKREGKRDVFHSFPSRARARIDDLFIVYGGSVKMYNCVTSA